MFARNGPEAGRQEEPMQEAETQAYLIAVDRRRVGVAVTVGDGYRFIAAVPDFRAQMAAASAICGNWNRQRRAWRAPCGPGA